MQHTTGEGAKNERLCEGEQKGEVHSCAKQKHTQGGEGEDTIEKWISFLFRYNGSP